MDDQNHDKEPHKQLIFNFIYFGSLFIVLAFLHVYSVLLAAHFSSASPWIFVSHAVMQAGMEAGILAFVAAILQSRGWHLGQKIFIIVTVLLCIAHFIDFHLVRLMDISIWYALDFVLDESWRNFLELLIASTVPFTKILMGVIVLSLFLFGAFYFYKHSQKFVQKKSSYSHPRYFLGSHKQKVALIATALSFCVWDYFSVHTIGIREYEKLAKALPLKRIFFSPSTEKLKLACQLKEPLQKQNFQNHLTTQSFALKTKPNVFLFVIETLREDYLTPETAPNLYAFKNENISFPLTRSSSNATPVSWFSLFFSQSPLHFGEIRKANWDLGCPTVQILKEAGYKLHLYSASRLSYYEMDQMLFGKNYQLADDYYIALPSRDHPAWQCDHATLAKLCSDIRSYKKEEGHLFVIFIESTHFDYSWPQQQQIKFMPFCDEINFFKAACLEENIHQIQNRYRNSIHYIDSLMGEVFTTLSAVGRMDDAVIVVTADHGEEFFEDGNLFHASGLSKQQIAVPLYCKFGDPTNKHFKPQTQMASHVDVLPSLLHYLYGQERLQDILDGESIFRTRQWPFIITGRYNGCRTPHEFLVQTDQCKVLHARFSKPSNPASSHSVHILDYKNASGDSTEITSQSLEDEFGPAFAKIFHPIE